jgi:phage terminase large subunit-like protein
MQFFAAGAYSKERLFMAANRVGKTVSGAYEATCHATGLYPAWWQGRRFTGPTDGWVCGTTSESTRDIVQHSLLGRPSDLGSGMIPPNAIAETQRRPSGLRDSLEQILVKHTSGGISTIGLKSYEQGRKSFEGTAKHWIWCDEEPPGDCYTEMLFRTVTTQGIIWCTFTPLQGMSEVVKGFIEPDEEAQAHKWYVQAGWNDAPHIPEDEKETLIATTPPHQLKARTEGEPSMGIGAITR